MRAHPCRPARSFRPSRPALAACLLGAALALATTACVMVQGPVEPGGCETEDACES